MSIFPMLITLLVGFMLVVVITNLLSKSRRAKNDPGDMNRFDRAPYERHPHDQYVSFSSEHETSHPVSHTHGHWGSRDMSHDQHDSSDSSDPGGGDWGGGDGGGDAGGSDGGGGGED